MRKTFTVYLILFCLSGCSIPKPKPTLFDPQTSIIALVLGEGMARSYAHIGVIKALEEEEIPIHLIVASGMGALMGALYSNKKSANDLEWHAMQLKKSDYMDFKIQHFLKDRLTHSLLEKLPIRLTLVTTDLKTGNPYLFEQGSIATGVDASLAIPGFFEPIEYDGKLLVSGEISRGLPVDIALQKGADLIIAVDLMQGIESYSFRKTHDITLQTYKITSAAFTKNQLLSAHVVIRPEVSKIDFLDFSRRREAMLAGYNAARAQMHELKRLLNLQEED